MQINVNTRKIAGIMAKATKESICSQVSSDKIHSIST